ncbi:MAG: 1-acyl-sn-glycerol-3-phosphate acyltransferase [Peptococcaceae bacterium]|nr:1-acyl-sn-glycerol-3-phosphate acyltransferase [Peptococcaceae bacterium]
MVRTIVWFIYFWLYLVLILPDLWKVNKMEKLGQKEKHDSVVFQIVRKWARSLLSLAGVTVDVRGSEHIPDHEAVVFISNHQGNFDIPILLGFIDKPKAFIAKVEILKMPLIRTWMTHMKCVFMDRSDIRQSLRTISQAADYVKQGYSMVIFPEGTRSKGNSIGEFKPGSFKLALKAGAPIIPVTIRGSYRIMEQQGFIIKPGKVEVIISEPISTKRLSKEEEALLPDRVRGIIEKNLT